MEQSKVKELLKKYWEGQTSLEEENMLKVYFEKTEGVDTSLSGDKALFQYYTQAGRESANIDFQLPEPSIQKKANKLSWLNQPVWKIAASVILILGVIFTVQTQLKNSSRSNDLTEETYEDPKVAYAEMKKALQMVSNKLNKGKKRNGQVIPN